ncbi:MAG: riboflavin kinase [Acidimicrobiales bacterium]
MLGNFADVHLVEGIVVEGDHRGRALGFPTANLEPGETAVPEDGIYAGYTTRADGSRYLSAISIGVRPTYYGDDAAVIVEAHLIDFDGDLYGERLLVEIEDLMREQVRFETEAELRAQIAADVEAVRAWQRALDPSAR